VPTARVTAAELPARDNHRARFVYERVGATREEWIDYRLPAGFDDPEE
jgi:hypothetical protein